MEDRKCSGQVEQHLRPKHLIRDQRWYDTSTRTMHDTKDCNVKAGVINPLEMESHHFEKSDS